MNGSFDGAAHSVEKLGHKLQARANKMKECGPSGERSARSLLGESIQRSQVERPEESSMTSALKASRPRLLQK